MSRAERGLILYSMADISRQQIIELLADRGELNGKDITTETGMAQPTVSKQLAILKRAGIVSARRDGIRTYFKVEHEPLAAMRQYLSDLNGCAPSTAIPET